MFDINPVVQSSTHSAGCGTPHRDSSPPPIDELRGVRRRPRFVRIDAALGGQKYMSSKHTASMRTNRGRRLTPHNSPILLARQRAYFSDSHCIP